MTYTDDQWRIVVQELIKAGHEDRLIPTAFPVQRTVVKTKTKQIDSNKFSRHEKKNLPKELIHESWNRYLTDLDIGSGELASMYGFSALSYLKERWKAEGIFDIVEYWKRNDATGVKGAPMDRIRLEVERAGRLTEIEDDPVEYEIVTESMKVGTGYEGV